MEGDQDCFEGAEERLQFFGDTSRLGVVET
jgi:hypothetical protein